MLHTRTESPAYTDLTDCAHGLPGAPRCACGREPADGANVPVSFILGALNGGHPLVRLHPKGARTPAALWRRRPERIPA